MERFMVMSFQGVVRFVAMTATCAIRRSVSKHAESLRRCAPPPRVHGFEGGACGAGKTLFYHWVARSRGVDDAVLNHA